MLGSVQQAPVLLRAAAAEKTPRMSVRGSHFRTHRSSYRRGIYRAVTLCKAASTAEEVDVVVVGAGVAGLCCARRLQEKGIKCKLLESSDSPAGRVKTDVHQVGHLY